MNNSFSSVVRMQKNRLLLVFPDGVGIKNYFYSDVFQPLDNDLLLFHNFGSETLEYLRSIKAIAGDFVIPDYKESAKEKFLRELISLSRLKYNAALTNNQTLFDNWKPQQRSLALKLFYKSIAFASHFFKSYSQILNLEKRYEDAIRKNAFYDAIKVQLNAIRPNVIFCTHQRGLKMATIFAAAKDLQIPTVTVIYSWDNLPKARLALRADKYLVWSEYMKQELKIYYPEITESSISITGTPQFEFYNNPKYIIDKATFFERYKLDFNKKIICYSGDDVRTAPDDPKYLEDLASEMVASGADKDFQILLRRAPVDISGRFDSVVARYPDLIKVSPPLWEFNNAQGWHTIFPSIDDVALLVSTAYYCDVVINIGSTMAFDFSIFDKPCIFINYDQEHKIDPNWSVEEVYNFQHFRSMPDKNAVFWLNSKKQVGELLRQVTTSGNSTSMKAWREVVLGDFGIASSKIQQTLCDL